MAATLTQQPTRWQLVYSPTVYVLAGLGSADNFIIQVEINGSIVTTLRQAENPAGRGIFDISTVLQSYLEPNFVEETTKVSQSNGEVLEYRIKYGIETAGIPLYTGYSPLNYAMNGYNNWRELNWDVTPYWPVVTEFECESYPGVYDGSIAEKTFLTNYPGEYTIRSSEWHTVSFINMLDNNTLAQMETQPYFVDIKHYNAAGAQVAQYNYTIDAINGLGPRTDCNDLGPYTYTPNQIVGHLGVGTKNLLAAGLLHPASKRYVISVYGLNYCNYYGAGSISDCDDIGELVDNYGDLIYQTTFNIVNDCTPFDPIRISFLNQYGVRDYYTFDRRNTYTVDSNRSFYKQTLGSWSSSSFSIDPVGRGMRVFNTEIREAMTLSSNWMDDATSKWLQELFTSPHVLIYKDGQWEPCVITSRSYSEQTKARQKMYRYDITVEYSNSKTVQRG